MNLVAGRARSWAVGLWVVFALAFVTGESLTAPILLGEFKAGGDIRSSPAVGPDGSVYFGTDAGEFFALQANGSIRWHVTVGAASQCSPAVARDGTVYFSASSWYLQDRWLEAKGSKAGAIKLYADGSQDYINAVLNCEVCLLAHPGDYNYWKKVFDKIQVQPLEGKVQTKCCLD